MLKNIRTKRVHRCSDLKDFAFLSERKKKFLINEEANSKKKIVPVLNSKGIEVVLFYGVGTCKNVRLMMHDIVLCEKRLGSISNIYIWHNHDSDLNLKKGWIVSIDITCLNICDNQKYHHWIGESIRPKALEKLPIQFLRRPGNEPFTPPSSTRSFYYFPTPEIEYGQYKPIAVRKGDTVKLRDPWNFLPDDEDLRLQLTVVSVSGYEEDQIILKNDLYEYYAKISDVIFTRKEKYFF